MAVYYYGIAAGSSRLGQPLPLPQNCPEKEADKQSIKNAIRLLVNGKPVEISAMLDRLKPLTEEPTERVRYFIPRDLLGAAKTLRSEWPDYARQVVYCDENNSRSGFPTIPLKSTTAAFPPSYPAAPAPRAGESGRMISRTEMTGNDQLVFESLATVEKIVQVHVAELVNLVLAMTRRTNVNSMMSTSEANIASQASRPSGELSPRYATRGTRTSAVTSRRPAASRESSRPANRRTRASTCAAAPKPQTPATAPYVSWPKRSPPTRGKARFRRPLASV